MSDKVDVSVPTLSPAVVKKVKFGVRHVQIILVFLCLTLSVAMRTNLSVAIVAMTDNTTSPNPNVSTYDWDNTSVILSAFFWGYIFLQVLGGYMARKYGPKYVLLVTTFFNTVAYVLIPVTADGLGSPGVIALRVVQGLAQGCLFPASHTVLGKWAPAEERSTMGIIVYSGLAFGSTLSLIVTGYICSSWSGWPLSFYIFGASGLAWCALYFKFGHNNPASHPTISPAERNYIEVSLGQVDTNEDIPIPWKSILTCIHFWAIVSANIGGSWGYAMMMTQIPTYLAKVMKFDIESNGVVSAVPYIVGGISGLMFAPLIDYLIAKDLLSRVNARRVFQLFGSYGLVMCLMLLSYVAKTKLSALLILSLGNIHYSGTLVGYAVNHVDLSPRFAGVMQGMANGMSQSIAIFSPLMVQFLVKERDNAAQWRVVFAIACVFYFVCATFYAIFASATRQKWDEAESTESSLYELSRRPTLLTIHSFRFE